MRVKILVDKDIEKLEEKINLFLSTNSYDVIDIKFSSTADDMSALVIYKVF